MRKIVLALALLSFPAIAQQQVIVSAPAMPSDVELKPFDFMGYVAGEQIPLEKMRKCGKGDSVECLEPLVKISNVYVGYLLKIEHRKISSLYIDAGIDSYDDLMGAFTKKYGEPCVKTVVFLQNAIGVKLDNPTSQWCFKTGRLTVSRYGGTINKMGILYSDNSKASPPPSTVNF